MNTEANQKEKKQNLFQKLKAMSRKKKIILVCVGIALAIALIAVGIFVERSARVEEPSLDEVVEEKLGAYETDLLDSLESLTTSDKVADYLVTWATNKNIKASKDANNNVIFSLKSSSKEYKGLDPVVIMCEYDANNMANYVEPISTALTVAKNAQEHPAFKVIFMPRNNGKMQGAETLASKYLADDAKIFVLGSSSSSKVATTTGGYKLITITDKLKKTKSENDKAYKISIENLPEHEATYAMNPIKTLGNLLANFKSTSLLFELSSFTGGDDPDTIPTSASVTVVINSADDEKFISKMDRAIEKYLEKYAFDYPNITYTYEEVDVPSKVFTKKETENIVSLMYTAMNGVYYKDDDGNIVAVTNIGEISTKKSKLSISISAMSSSAELLDEIREAYRTIAGLCDVKSKTTKSYDVYAGGGKTAVLLDEFEASFMDYTGDSKMIVEEAYESTPCSVFAEEKEGLSMLYFGVTEKTKEKFAGSIITFLNAQGTTTE